MGETPIEVEAQPPVSIRAAPAASEPPDASSAGLPIEAQGWSRRRFLVNAATATLAFGWGVGAGYWTWGRTPAPSAEPAAAVAVPTPQPPTLGLPHSYTLPVAYGLLGPQLIQVGAFAYEAFAQVYAEAGQPLSAEQQAILREGSDAPVVIDHANAYFLLNLLWALGLSNNNRLLREGALVANSGGQVDRFASTGGWSLAAKPIAQLYSGSALVTLTEAQQARVEEAAAAIYRPCCNNPTSFPDCNHGMAMLGLLQWLAAQDADVDTLFEAAKMVNSFWYPTQARELTLYYQAQTGEDFAAIPAREAVGRARFSSDGFGEVHNWLAANGKLEAPSQNGSGCGV
ncbi:MAG: hypothetical protein DCC57_10935 [Chloroflexi bacterium]|nr:MAG: hypothetical protein DCC57_10935 [Chloroflexota bacterium]